VTSNRTNWAWAPALGLLAASFAASCWLALRPVDPHFVAAVFPPWWSEARSIAAVVSAEGALVGRGGLASIVVTRSDLPDFDARLRQAGALVLLEPSRLLSCSGNGGSTEKQVTQGAKA